MSPTPLNVVLNALSLVLKDSTLAFVRLSMKKFRILFMYLKG